MTDGRPGHENNSETQDVTVTAPQPIGIGVSIAANGCMVDISVDVGNLALRDVGGLAVSRVTVNFRRSNSNRTETATRVGTSSRWEIRNYNIGGLGTGNLNVTAEAIEGSLLLGRGTGGQNVSCSS